MMVSLLYHISCEKKREAWTENDDLYFLFCRIEGVFVFGGAVWVCAEGLAGLFGAVFRTGGWFVCCIS